MSSFNQSNMNDSRNTSRRSSLLFSNRNLDDSIASRQSRENSFISTSRYKSPFYEGKVSFGGSSAKRVRLSQVLPYNIANKPTSIVRIKDSDIKRSDEFDQLSSATKNMLENIYKASSPLEDAKKIPTFTSNQSSEKFMIDSRPFKRLSSLRTPKLAANLKTTSPLDREKLQLKWEELENSSSHSLNSSLQHLQQNNLIADASSSFYNQSRLSSNQEHQSSAGGKMRNRLTRTNRLGKWSEDDYMPPQYDLPEVSLPINSNSLPTFNLNKKSTQLQYNKSPFNVNSNTLKRPLVTITHEDDSSDAYDDEFQFSAPKAIKLEKISDSFLKDSIRKDIVELSSSSIDRTNQQEKESSTNLTIPQSQQTKPPPTTQCLNLVANKTVEMYKLDKLESDFNPKENKATLANTNLPAKSAVDLKLSSGFNYDGLSEFAKSNLSNAKKWSCDTCDVSNELSATKCIACEQPKLKEVKDKKLNFIYSNYSFNPINIEKNDFNAFKLDSKSQQPATVLPTIFTSNSSVPDVPTSTVTQSLTNSNSLTNSLSSNSKIDLTTPNTTSIDTEKQKTDKVSNSESITTASKPTTNEQTKPFDFITNEVADKVENEKSNLKPSTNSWGAQFLPPKDNWSCPSCFTSNKSSFKKCPCCEEPNPNEPKETKEVDTKPALSFTNPSTGGFSFNIAPITSASTTTKPEFGFNKMPTTSESDQPKGFSFASLAPATSAKSDNQSAAAKFNFGLAAPSLTTPPTTNLSTNKPEISLSDSVKPLATNLNESSNAKTSSLFSVSTANTAPSFTFGQPAKDSLLTNKTSPSDQLSNKPVSSSNFVFGSAQSPNSSNLNNGELTFNPPSTNQPSQQTTSLFALPSANNSNVSNTSATTFNTFNQFGNKAQFGLSSTSPSTNIFSPPTNLSNGFTSPTNTDSGNLFSAAAQTTNTPAPPINNFSNVFSQVPSSNFSFGSTDQSQNNNGVFQFSAPKSDTPIAQSPLLLNSSHGRFIKKAKRRLG